MLRSGVLQDDFAARFKTIGSTQPRTRSYNSGTPADGSPLRFLRLPEVRARVPYSRATIYRLITAGQFPRPYSMGARAVAWLESDVTAWIEARLSAPAPSANPQP
jgi:prophage regulatory protein